ncbi:MAG: sigma-70 family RNA polymerase sigma factor [Clostridia bacterium]
MSAKDINRLLIELKNGNESVFNELYSVTRKGVYSIALSVLNEHYLTEDVMQITYIKVRKNIMSYKDDTNGLAWILTIAKNTALNELKKHRRTISVDFQEEAVSNSFGEYSMTLPETPLIDLMKKNLTDKEFNIMMLHTVSGYKHKDIAVSMDIPLGSCLWTYNNALKKMKNILSKEEF